MTARYAATPEDWAVVAAALLASPRAGYDTEYYRPDGQDARKFSSRTSLVHVWSVALEIGEESPRGYPEVASMVLPAAALRHPGLRRWLESDEHLKYASNAPVDAGSAESTVPGLTVRGLVDTVQVFRWLMPERSAASGGGGFELGALGQVVLGRPKTGNYDELFSRPYLVEVVKRRKRRICPVCVAAAPETWEIAPPCRRRTDGHGRVDDVVVTTEVVERGTERIPLDTIVPGHELFPVLLEYAARDAELGLQLGVWAEREGRLERRARAVPW